MALLEDVQDSLKDVWTQVRDFMAPARQQMRDVDKARFPHMQNRHGWGMGGGSYGRGQMGDRWGQGQDRMSDLSHDLHQRYIDYEDMDDYPEISAALDAFADEATQRDFLRNQQIWAEGGNDNIVSDINYLLHKQIEADGFIWELTRNLSKYGNNMERLFVTADGVVGTEPLPTAITRRVNDNYGQLAGFVVSSGGDYNVSSEQFRSLIDDASTNDMSSKAMLGGAGGTIGFEHWEVSHFRLVGKNRHSEYGFAITDPARWVFRRLVMMEDAALVHKLCLHGDSEVWTPDGTKPIRDIEEGDEVYSFGHDAKLHRTEVTYHKHNGTDEIFEIESRHRTLRANATHPVLCHVIEGNGKGSPRSHRFEYVEAQDLEPRKHRLVTPSKPVDDAEEIELKKPEVGTNARFRVESVGEPDITEGIKALKQKVGVQCDIMRQFFAGEYHLKGDTARRLVAEKGYDPDEALEEWEDWGGIQDPNLPKHVDPDFAEWFGFMIGDGFLCERNHPDGYTAKNGVGFALGDDESTNDYYRHRFEQYVGEVPKRGAVGGRLGSYAVYSSALYEFMELNGYNPGAHDKMIPEWVFRARPSIKWAFLKGLFDADGHYQPETVSEDRGRVNCGKWVLEMCNETLVQQVRELAMQLGLVVSRVHYREREGGHEIGDSGREMPPTESWRVTVSEKEQPISEPILSVETVGEDDIYDIGVSHECHNFTVDGVVTHNTRAPSRYAFYVDIGERSMSASMGYLEKVKNFYKRKKVVNPKTGKIDMSYDPTALDEDFFVPVHSDRGEAVRIETLNGPDYQAMDDVDYFRKKLGRAIKIPNFGRDDKMHDKPLSSEHIRFANAVMRLQNAVREGFRKIAKVHLIATGRNPKQFDWDIYMAVPSSIMELARMEVLSAKSDIMRGMKDHVSVRWMLVNLFGFSEDEAVELMVQREEEKDMVAAADLERELNRERLKNVVRESAEVDRHDGDIIQEGDWENRKRKMGSSYVDLRETETARKLGRGAYGISESEYDSGRSDMSVGEVLESLESIEEGQQEIRSRFTNLRDLLQNIQQHSTFQQRT